MKFMISMDDALFERVNEYTEKHHISRSGLLAISVSQYLDAMDALPGLQSQIDDLKKALDNMAVVK